MADKVVIYGFETSINFKVRVGLGYKGIPFEFVTIDPKDRSEIQRLSGQPFTPVMVHGDVVLFDSAAILRYLDANFPGTPRLFGGDHATMRQIEDWEFFGRVDLHQPLSIMVKQRISGIEDLDATAQAAVLFAAGTERIEEHLRHREWLVGDAMTAADVTVASVVRRVREMGAFEVPEDRPRTYAWTARIMAHDPGPKRSD
jgi:glutathione S-transferase